MIGYFSVIVVLLILLILIFSLDYYSKNICTDKIIYKNTLQPVSLDTQFSPSNFPSYVFKDLFEQSSPWIGGTTIGLKGYIVPTTASPYSTLSSTGNNTS